MPIPLSDGKLRQEADRIRIADVASQHRQEPTDSIEASLLDTLNYFRAQPVPTAQRRGIWPFRKNRE